MKTCPKCKNILFPSRTAQGSVLKCLRCNYSEKHEEIARTEHSKKEERKIDVVTEAHSQNMLPTIKVKCPKCGHEEAEYWTVQTRAVDEPETRFHRCLKCKHTWREYS